MQSKVKTKVLVECALMISVATVLSRIEIPLWAQGGSITAASMLPIIMVSYRHGTKLGLLTAFVHSLIQLVMGFSNVLYCKTLVAQALCILLDYTLAFTVLGLAAMFGSVMKKSESRILIGVCSVGALRLLCSFLSGIILWSAYAPEGTPVWIYSLLYNGGYMIPEVIITSLAALLLRNFLSPQY